MFGSPLRLVAPVLAVLVGLVAGCSADQGEAFDVAVAATVEALRAEVPTVEPTVVEPTAMPTPEPVPTVPVTYDETAAAAAFELQLTAFRTGPLLSWKAEEARKAQINSSIATLQQTLDNFKEDSFAAERRHGEEGLILFMEGHRRRYEGLIALKEELAAFDTDGLQHRSTVKQMFDDAGIDTRNMDDWTPEELDRASYQAVGVATGNIRHPDTED
jgi:hypothetical protein